MNRPRRNFVLSLILFLAWVSALTLMASTSGERPRVKATPAVSR